MEVDVPACTARDGERLGGRLGGVFAPIDAKAPRKAVGGICNGTGSTLADTPGEGLWRASWRRYGAS